MMILVTYDVSLQDSSGAKRLRQLARTCLDYGQRAQFSVFEIEVDAAQWVMIKNKLIKIMDEKVDSLRFYYLGNHWKRKVEHIGTKKVLDLNAPLIL